MVWLSLVLAITWVMAGLTTLLVITAVQGHWYNGERVGLKFITDLLTWPVVTLAMCYQLFTKTGWFSPDRFIYE